MAIGRITGQMLSSTLSRGTTDLTIATTGESNLFVVDATNDRIGIGLNNPTAQFQTSGNVIIGGNLTVNGTTNTINSTTVTVDDKNIELGSTSSPSDAGADGGGITLKGDSDKTINWVNSTGYWTSNQGWDLTSGNAYHIGGTQVLDANNLDLESMNINGSVISSNSNADISIQPSGTGVLKLSGLSIDGDVITSDDSTAIGFGENVNINGSLDVGSNLTLSNGTAVSAILDEDNMASDSASSLATQQSIKAYVDNAVGSLSSTTITEGNTNVTVADSGSGTITMTVDGSTVGQYNASGLQLGGSGARVTTVLDEDAFGSDSDTALATQQSIKAYVDAQDANIASDTLTLTNKTFDANGTGNSISNIEVADFASAAVITVAETLASNDSDTAFVTAGAIIDYVDAQDANIASDTLTFTNKTFDANATGNSISNIEVADMAASAVVTESEGLASSDNDTSIPTTAAVIDYVSANAGGTITLGDDASNAGAVNLANDEQFVFHSGNSITGTVTGNGVTYALNDAIVVNAISSADSTFVRINDSLETESAQINSTLTVDGDATVKGSLTVEGTTTYIETTNTKVSDPIMLLNNGNSGGSDIDSGIMVERGSAGNNAVFYWNEGADRFKAVLSTSDSEGTSITDSSYATVNVGGLVFAAESVIADSILDEDNMASDSATALATQQSIKAYVDAQDAAIASDTLTFTNKTFDANGTGNSISNLEVADFASGVVKDEDNMASDSATSLATQQSIKAYVDAETANVASDTLTFTNKTFDANGTGNSISNLEVADFAGSAIINVSETLASNDSDTALVTAGAIIDYVDAQDANIASDTLTFTNKTFDANGTGNSISNIEVADLAAGAVVIESEGIGSNDNDTTLPTSAAVKDYVDTQVAASTVTSINDIGNVDAASVSDGDVLVVNDDSSDVFTASSQMVTGLRVPLGTTAQRPTAYQGIIRFNSNTGKYEGSTDGSTFVAFAMDGSAETLNKDVFTGDGGASYNFSNVTDPTAGDNSNGATGLLVYIDNVLQEPTQNFTVSSTAITFDSAVHSGARIVVIQGFDGSAGGGVGGEGLTTISNTDVDSAVENVDTFATTEYRSAHYHYVIENDDASEYQTGQIHVIHDGTNAQISEFGVLRTGNNDLITFTADVNSGSLRLRGSAQTPNSKFKAKRISLEVQ